VILLKIIYKMILDKFVNITIHPTTVLKYRNLGYICNVKDIIEIPIEILSLNSHIEINIKCDICGNEKKLSFSKYNKNINNGDYYACSKICSSKKSKETCLEKYGDENYNNREKNKETCLKKYGDENYNNREKYKETCLEKYGEEHYNKIEYYKNKIGISKLEKYGDKNYNNKEKYKKTCLKKYGLSTNLLFPDILLKCKNNRINNKLLKYEHLNIIKYDDNKKKFTLMCKNGHDFDIDYNNMYNRIKYNVNRTSIKRWLKQYLKKDNINSIINENSLTIKQHKAQLNKIKKEDRPSFEILFNEVYISGYTITGNKYNVIDTTIKKWLVHYKNNNDMYKDIDLTFNRDKNNYTEKQKLYHLNSRKVKNRPSLGELENLLKEFNYTEVGKIYNVVGKTIKKWLDNYLQD